MMLPVPEMVPEAVMVFPLVLIELSVLDVWKLLEKEKEYNPLRVPPARVKEEEPKLF